MNSTPTDTTDFYVFGFELDGNGGGRSIDSAFSQLQKPVWQHLDYSMSGAAEWLAQKGLDSGMIETLTRSDTRPRTVPGDKGVAVLLRGINMNPGAEPDDMVSLRIWMERNRIFTIRQRRLMAAQDIKQNLQDGSGPADLQMLLLAIVERLADRIADFVDGLEEQIEREEDLSGSINISQHRAQLSAMRRQIASVRRYLAPQREALEALARNPADLLDEKTTYEIREQSDRITRYVEDLDLLRERTLVAYEELTNRIAEQQNARTYVLSIVAAIFLPITFITGMFGMNVAGLPGMEKPDSFWLVCGVMILVTVLMFIYLRIRRWF